MLRFWRQLELNQYIVSETMYWLKARYISCLKAVSYTHLVWIFHGKLEEVGRRGWSADAAVPLLYGTSVKNRSCQ